MAHEVPVTHARTELSELVNRVVYTDDHVVLTRHGRPVAALVSITDLERLEHVPGTGARGVDVPDKGDSPAPGQVVGRHRANAPGAKT